MKKSIPTPILDSIKIEWEFVPFSKSRNAGEKNLSLNWRGTFQPIGACTGFYTFDYMQGIGHLPGFIYHRPNGIGYNRSPKDYLNYERNAAETGKCESVSGIPGKSHGSWNNVKPIPPPSTFDALYCLLGDSSAIDYATYEEWAREFGYDEGSRKGEKIYQECINTFKHLQNLFGEETLQKIREEVDALDAEGV